MNTLADQRVRPQGALPPSTSVDGPVGTVARSDTLLVRLSQLAPVDPGRVAMRTQVVELYLPLTVSLARRFNGRGEPLADLTQVAVIGLIKAVDRYDPRRGVAFATFAIPTILGEIKRHFRDTTWNVRVPRRLQELVLELGRVTEDLVHRLHRFPTAMELAAVLGVAARDVLLAQQCANAYRPLSMDQLVPDSNQSLLTEALSRLDPELEAVVGRETLRVALAGLPEREQQLLALRYVREMSQSQIAAELGVSQMHISRLLSRALTRLRDTMLTVDGDLTSAAAVRAPVRRVVVGHRLSSVSKYAARTVLCSDHPLAA